MATEQTPLHARSPRQPLRPRLPSLHLRLSDSLLGHNAGAEGRRAAGAVLTAARPAWDLLGPPNRGQDPQIVVRTLESLIVSEKRVNKYS